MNSAAVSTSNGSLWNLVADELEVPSHVIGDWSGRRDLRKKIIGTNRACLWSSCADGTACPRSAITLHSKFGGLNVSGIYVYRGGQQLFRFQQLTPGRPLYRQSRA